MTRSASASRTRSPVVGPHMSAKLAHFIFRAVARLVSIRPQSYPPGLWVVRFRLRAETHALSLSPDAHVRFAGCEDRQDQIGLGDGAATGAVPCGWFDPGSQRRGAALRAGRGGASPPVIAFGGSPR